MSCPVFSPSKASRYRGRQRITARLRSAAFPGGLAFGNPGSTLKPPTAEPYAALCYEGSEAPVAPCFIRSFRIGSSLGSVKRSKVDTF